MVPADTDQRRVRGSRDRDRQVRSTGLRVRRHRDRAQPPYARPRGCRHLLGPRRVQARAPDDGRRDGRRRLARDRGRGRPPRRSRVPEPRRALDPLRRSGVGVRGDRGARAREGDAPHAGAVRGTAQARADRAAHPRDQRGRRHRLRVAHAAAGRAVRAAHPRSRARRARRAGHGRLRGARVEGPEPPAAQPQALHP